MGKWIKGIMTAAMLLFVAFLGYSLTSCDHESVQQKLKHSDSAFVVGLIEEYHNPKISNEDDAVLVQNQLLSEREYETLFVNLPQSTLKAIVHVLQRQSNSKAVFTIKDVCQEYISNRKVYDNLPKCTEGDPEDYGNDPSTALPDTLGGKQYGYKSYCNPV